MNHKKTAIVVCGIKNHIILLNKLKARGFHTILVDGAARPIAFDDADEFVQIDIFDFEGIKQLAIERKVDLIINACQEHLNAGICKICEEIGLPHPYSYETAMMISNKEQMKKRMKEFDIPTTSYFCVSKPEDVGEVDLNFPLYVKSCEGSGSNAVNRAVNKEEVKLFVEKALARYPGKRVVIEEEAQGHEYNVYCFPENGKANVLLVARRHTDNLSEDRVTKLIGTWATPFISQKAMNAIYETADKITRAFTLDNVPMFMQIMIKGDNINVIEFAGRMAGGFGYQTIYDSTGFDWFEATINGFLRIPNHVSYHAPDGYITVSHVYGYPCVFGELKGYQELLKDGTIGHVLLPKSRGMKVTENSANGSLVAYMIHQDKTIDGLLAKIQKTFDCVELYDINGKPCLNKKLHLTKEMLEDRDQN